MAITRAGSVALQSLSVLVLLLLWQAAAALVGTAVLPQPAEVLKVMIREAWQGELLHHLAITLARVAASFMIAMGIGLAIGIVMGRRPWIDRLFDLWLTIFLNLPALVIIILAYVWFGLIEAAAIGAVAVNKIPNVAVTIREGAKALNPELSEMASVYAFGRWRTLRHVILPQLWPYVLGSARSGLALIWKIVLVVELLGRPDGVGFQLHVYFQFFDVAGILAYALAFILVIQLIEQALTKPLERHVSRWR